jgi:hypothetical protein
VPNTTEFTVLSILTQTGEFDQRHGGHQKSIVIGNMRVFEDGAQRVIHNARHPGSMAGCIEPPSDPILLARIRKLYVDTKLKQEVKDFNTYKADCIQKTQLAARYPHLPSIGDFELQQLEAGKARIEVLTNQLEELQLALSGTPEEVSKRQRAAMDADYQIRRSITTSRLNQIQI